MDQVRGTVKRQANKRIGQGLELPLMPTTIKKEWGAIDGDEIVARADSKQELKSELKKLGKDENGLEIVALPKDHNSMFV